MGRMEPGARSAEICMCPPVCCTAHTSLDVHVSAEKDLEKELGHRVCRGAQVLCRGQSWV